MAEVKTLPPETRAALGRDLRRLDAWWGLMKKKAVESALGIG